MKLFGLRQRGDLELGLVTLVVGSLHPFLPGHIIPGREATDVQCSDPWQKANI